MHCYDDDPLGGILLLLLVVIMVCVAIGCCDNGKNHAVQSTTQPTSAPIIVPNGMLLTRDLAGQTGPGQYAFEIFKVDLPQGSFGLKNGLLHKYAGHTIWDNIEDQLPNNPWKQALKAKLQEMLDKHLISEEGVIYKPDGNVEMD